MDTREVARFLSRLYGEGDEFEVAYIRPTADEGGRVARVKRVFAPGMPLAEIQAEMERGEAAGFNVYVSALPVSRQASRTFDRIWVDQDDPTAPWPFGSDERFEHPAWPKPTTLVQTSEAEGGFRWQAIWKLHNELDEEAARSTMKRLAAQIGADGSVHDPRRVLRVPGILNAKRGMNARLMETSQGTVPIESFELPKVSAIDALMNGPVQNPEHVLGEWLAGTSEGDRARKAYVTARFLKSCGVTWGDAAPIMKLGAMRCKPPM
ncbi:MAG TPA: DNA-primase RepB domain-containing protein, partial [Candidatus Krumholzibacterium sp.]|nr:DNA-primase RepB domain-containing protein [Candidatus Krumholzibacterium sp.]